MRLPGIIFTCLLMLPPLPKAAAAVVVTYRGSNPNVLPVFLTGATPFDINADGINDLLFTSNGLFAALQTYGTNRISAFVDLSGFYSPQVVPAALGSEIGPGSSFDYADPFVPGFGNIPGRWHHGTDSGSPNGFLLGYSNSGFMQYANGYIGIEFMAADGIHYGWIQYEGFAVAQVPLYGLNGEILGYTQGISGAQGGFVNSWGWETAPNMPIIAGSVPEPGRVALSIFAFISSFLRRKRQWI
ncbi:MAG: hypothetical protein JNN17_11990 [Verrucomicrobiaceae bacterium]|nr:hypothetical protein [Verrucomicrobiaceae bacterium]